MKSLSHAPLLATPWTAAYQVPLSMGFSRQEYWSGEPLPSPDNMNTMYCFPFHRSYHNESQGLALTLANTTKGQFSNKERTSNLPNERRLCTHTPCIISVQYPWVLCSQGLSPYNAEHSFVFVCEQMHNKPSSALWNSLPVHSRAFQARDISSYLESLKYLQHPSPYTPHLTTYIYFKICAPIFKLEF